MERGSTISRTVNARAVITGNFDSYIILFSVVEFGLGVARTNNKTLRQLHSSNVFGFHLFQSMIYKGFLHKIGNGL